MASISTISASTSEFINNPLFNDANCVAYYKLENVNDSKGTRNLGNPGGTTFGTAKFNNGIATGLSNYLFYVVNNYGITGTTNCTICGWTNISGNPNSGNNYVVFKSSSSTPRDFALYYNNNRTLTMDVGGTTTTIAHEIFNAFFHWAIVRDNTGGNAYIYINGLLKGSSGIGTTAGASDNFFINSDNTGVLVFSAAQADDVVIFSRALTANEILSIASINTISNITSITF